MVTATMPDQEENKEIQHLGTYRWNELDQLKPYPTGIKMMSLAENMWSKSGLKTERTDPKLSRKYSVIFDKTFVLEFLHSRVFVPLGINKNGSFNRDLLDEILEDAIAYSLDADKREKEAEMLRMAKPYIEEKGLSPDQALELVKIQREAAEKYLANLGLNAK